MKQTKFNRGDIVQLTSDIPGARGITIPKGTICTVINPGRCIFLELVNPIPIPDSQLTLRTTIVWKKKVKLMFSA